MKIPIHHRPSKTFVLRRTKKGFIDWVLVKLLQQCYLQEISLNSIKSSRVVNKRSYLCLFSSVFQKKKMKTMKMRMKMAILSHPIQPYFSVMLAQLRWTVRQSQVVCFARKIYVPWLKLNVEISPVVAQVLIVKITAVIMTWTEHRLEDNKHDPQHDQVRSKNPENRSLVCLTALSLLQVIRSYFCSWWKYSTTVTTTRTL